MVTQLMTVTETMSSLQIAEITGKRHSDVLEAIRTMEPAWEKIAQRKFPLGSYLDANNQPRPCYNLNKTECLYVATKFNDEARAKLVIRWEELERQHRTGGYEVPQSFSQALLLAAHQAEQIEAQRRQIEAEAPKVLFASAVEESKKSILIGELAKIIQQNGFNIGQKRMFQWLRANDYLCSVGEAYNLPTQKAMNMHLFELKKTTITKPDGTILVSTTPKVTGKGQIYFVNKFLNVRQDIAQG